MKHSQRTYSLHLTTIFQKRGNNDAHKIQNTHFQRRDSVNWIRFATQCLAKTNPPRESLCDRTPWTKIASNCAPPLFFRPKLLSTPTTTIRSQSRPDTKNGLQRMPYRSRTRGEDFRLDPRLETRPRPYRDENSSSPVNIRHRFNSAKILQTSRKDTTFPYQLCSKY